MSEPQLLRSASYFPVASVAPTVAYYERVLGFRAEYVAGDEFAIVSRDGYPLMFRRVETPDRIRPGEAQGGTWDAFFWVRDARALHDELVSRGADGRVRADRAGVLPDARAGRARSRRARAGLRSGAVNEPNALAQHVLDVLLARYPEWAAHADVRKGGDLVLAVPHALTRARMPPRTGGSDGALLTRPARTGHLGHTGSSARRAASTRSAPDEELSGRSSRARRPARSAAHWIGQRPAEPVLAASLRHALVRRSSAIVPRAPTRGLSPHRSPGPSPPRGGPERSSASAVPSRRTAQSPEASRSPACSPQLVPPGGVRGPTCVPRSRPRCRGSRRRIASRHRPLRSARRRIPRLHPPADRIAASSRAAPPQRKEGPRIVPLAPTGPEPEAATAERPPAPRSAPARCRSG